MNCKYCGSENAENTTFCTNCGATLEAAPAPAAPQQPVYQQPVYQQPVYQQPYQNAYAQPAVPAIPEEYKPISPWGYLGYNLLFCIPLVGFILLIVFSCGGSKNINLKNYARSFWCALLLSVIIGVVMGVLIGILGAAAY